MKQSRALEFSEEDMCMRKLMILAVIFVCVLGLSACGVDKENTDRESVSDFTVAAFEYRDDDGYKLITSEIDSLDTFDSLLLKPTETEFSGEWIYRIVYNPSEYSKNTEEFVILFGEESVSINGKNYIGDDVPYSEILGWASSKYEFFDYELTEN